MNCFISLSKQMTGVALVENLQETTNCLSICLMRLFDEVMCKEMEEKHN